MSTELVIPKQFAHRPGFRPNQVLVDFANGYTASVINDGYGSREGLTELAVLYQGAVCYDTPVTDDVLGHLTREELLTALLKVEALAPRQTATL